jgi:pilus assembly protein CpaF
MSSVVFGFGPLEGWLHDESVTEVLVNGGRDVWIERRSLGTDAGGGPQYVGRLDEGVLHTIIERILAPIGRRLDRSSPVVDARLPDGSRVCAVLPPIAVDGACLAVRRFATEPFPLSAFASPPVVTLLEAVIAGRCNVLVSGATSSGKTTLLNSLASCIAADERIVTLEDTAELRLATRHVLRLESRPATPDGLPAIELADLLRTALRLRPDRLVVGEIRGSEAVHLVQALNTGHDGSLATLHANSPVEALARLESLVVRDSPGWTMEAVRAQVHRSVDVVVQVGRDHGRRRRVLDVVEVLPEPDHRPGSRLVDVLAHGDEVIAPLTRARR